MPASSSVALRERQAGAAPVPYQTQFVHSADGTLIAYELIGGGPPLIIVDGALCYREMGGSKELAKRLSSDFTVLTYDRRGRGESSDAVPYAVEREIEDLQALLKEVGASGVWGMSSGAFLAVELAKKSRYVTKLAIYEAPLIVGGSRPSTEGDWSQIQSALGRGDRSRALRLFLKSVGVPAIFRALLRITPDWRKLKSIAHTLAYDGALVRQHQLGRPLKRSDWEALTQPVLVSCGQKSAAWMRSGNEALAEIIPRATYRELAGQSHLLKPEVHAPLLAEFFAA